MSLNGHDGTSPMRPSVTLGVLTYASDTRGFGRFLAELRPALDEHEGEVELFVVNNGGAALNEPLRRRLEEAGLASPDAVVPAGTASVAGVLVRVVDSPENNIAVARNLVLDGARHSLVAFLDDDERPARGWLAALVRCLAGSGAAVVSGPVHPLYAGRVARWLQETDLHNTRGKRDGERLVFVGAGNCLIDRDAVGERRFDPRFGTSGGEDTEYFWRLSDAGLEIRWCAAATAEEHVGVSRSGTAHVLRRFLAQGLTYRRVARARGRVKSELAFSVRAVATFLIALPIALVLLALRRPEGGDWLKRAVSNLGKVVDTGGVFYGDRPHHPERSET